MGALYVWVSSVFTSVMCRFGMFALALGSGCASSHDTSSVAHNAATETPQPTMLDAQAAPGASDSAFVFDPLAVRHYEVSVAPDDWEMIKRFPVKEQYIRGKLTYEGRTYEPIALRFKGSRGSLFSCYECCSTSHTRTMCPGPEQSCYDGNGMIAPSECEKLSYKIDFHNDWGETDFFGLDRLNIHAPSSDAPAGDVTLGLRERLSYSIFQEFGVIAPRTAAATLSVNGESLGVYNIVEVVSETFARRAFGDRNPGNLYKQRWPTLSTDSAYYESGLENNTGQPNVSKMVELAQAISTATDDTIEGILRERMDLDAFMRYLAVDRAIGNNDGPLTFRCKDGSTVPALPPDVLAEQESALPWEICQNKNFFFYERGSEQRIYLVPWDLNLALYPTFAALDWARAPRACDRMQWNGRSPQCDPLIRWSATVMYPQFLQAAQELLSRSFDLNRLNARVDEWVVGLLPVALAVEPGLTEEAFFKSLDTLKRNVASARTSFASRVGVAP